MMKCFPYSPLLFPSPFKLSHQCGFSPSVALCHCPSSGCVYTQFCSTDMGSLSAHFSAESLDPARGRLPGIASSHIDAWMSRLSISPLCGPHPASFSSYVCATCFLVLPVQAVLLTSGWVPGDAAWPMPSFLPASRGRSARLGVL